MFIDPMLLISSAILICSIWILHAKAISRLTAFSVAVCVLFFLLATVTFTVINNLTGNGIDESVVYHLRTGLSGAGFGDFHKIIIGAAIALFLSMLITFFIYRYLRHGLIVLNPKMTKLGVLTAIIAILIHPTSRDIGIILWPNWDTSGPVFSFITPKYKIPKEAPLNIIYIYLESLEKTYFDENRFPSLVPELKKLEQEGVSFSNIDQVYATGFTIAGIVASQCGIPLATSSSGNSMSGMDKFLSGSLCMGDILNDQGYSLEFLGGAPIDFAGKGAFFRTHGFKNVYGNEELSQYSSDPKYRSNWGLYDDTLLDIAFSRLRNLESTNHPFGMFLLTLDTHHPEGHLSDSCLGKTYQEGNNPILNAVHCSDYLVSRFIQRIKKHNMDANTLIVVASDHLAMPNTATSILKQGERKNLFFVLPPYKSNQYKHEISHLGSPLDIAPTILTMMGFDIPALGFGRNLISEQNTLMESYADADAYLKAHRGFLNKFWEFPGLDNGLLIDAKREVARMGERVIKIPSLLFLDNALRVDKILFDPQASRLAAYLQSEKPSRFFVWIDRCRAIAALGSSVDVAGIAGENICTAIGRLEVSSLRIDSVPDDFYYSKADIENAASWTRKDDKAAVFRLNRLSNLSIYDNYEVRNLKIGLGWIADWVIRSSSYGTGFSYVKSLNKGPHFGKVDNSLGRGVTLFGLINKTGGAKPLAYFDSCNPLNDQKNHPVSFAEFFKSQHEFDIFVIVAHDSMSCGNFDLSPLFSGTSLSRWKEVSSRQPYIGVVLSTGMTFEFLGEESKPYTLHLYDQKRARRL